MQGVEIKVSQGGTITSQTARLIDKITSKMTKESITRDYVITLEDCGSVEVHVEVEL